MSNGPIVLPSLPYAENALEPVISANTIRFHFGKHHAGYVNKLNGFISGTDMADMDLEMIVKKAAADGNDKVFNNAAQIWNHTFYWNSMTPNGGGEPSAKMAEMLDASFGSYASFKEQFSAAAGGQFGSGWAWLINRGGTLEIATTDNAETPLVGDATPLLTLDVWEHAYYLDYQNRRPDYIGAVIDKLLNWNFAEENLG